MTPRELARRRCGRAAGPLFRRTPLRGPPDAVLGADIIVAPGSRVVARYRRGDAVWALLDVRGDLFCLRSAGGGPWSVVPMPGDAES